MNVIAPIENTSNIRYADFVQVITPTTTYRFATTPTALTISGIGTFDGLGSLVGIGEVQRWVLGQEIKGSQITMWKGFFDVDGNLITGGGTSGLYQYFFGYVNTFTISEQWMEDARMFVGMIAVSASSIQIILQNRTGGRFTNDASWKFYNPTDTSMNRVGFVSTIY